MSKLKPNKGLLKRVKVTGRGKVKYKRTGTSHLNSHMSGKAIRQRRQKRTVKSADIKRLSTMLHRPLRGT